MDMNIGSVIKRLRIAQSVTQEDLAEYLGISYQAVSKWETGVGLPDITLLPKIAVFFGVRIDELFSISHEDEMERIRHILDYEKMNDGNFAYAKRTLDTMLSENSKNVDAIKTYAKVILTKSNEELLSAGKMLEKAMETSPLDDEIYNLYRAVRGGGEYKYHSDNDWFIRVCEPYARKHPQKEGLCNHLVEAMISQQYFDKAEEIICMMQPSAEKAFMKEILLGDVQVKRGNTKAAKKIWETVSEEDWRAQYEVGERLNRLNEYEDAIACFKRAFDLQKAPKRALDMVYSLAFLYKKLGRFEEAVKAWECILQVLKEDYGLAEGNDVEWAKRELLQLKELIDKDYNLI